ncbi:MAG: hypothetical protein L0Y72_24425 [Gemmataceae bacterium]|nr:hypothetical protein [Gemmataceae bacterium]MCI0742192.1 hypothetical protein [Gemmataceae bacterium]
MIRHERFELGEKWFLVGVLGVLASEGVLTIISNSLHFTWIGLLLGLVGFCLVMGLANRIYAGNKQAVQIALAWVAFQLVYAVGVLLLMATSNRGAEIAESLGAPVAWTVLWKGLVYFGLGWVLFRTPAVREFFAQKRGDGMHLQEAAVETKPAEVPAPDSPLALTAEQTASAVDLSGYLKKTMYAFLTLGVLQIILALTKHQIASLPGVLALAEGALWLILGTAMSGPWHEVSLLGDKDGQTRNHLLGGFGSLLGYFKIQAVVALGLIAVWVVRFAIS